jgi:hypothetical protein
MLKWPMGLPEQLERGIANQQRREYT